jgi:hypothetical protein
LSLIKYCVWEVERKVGGKAVKKNKRKKRGIYMRKKNEKKKERKVVIGVR